MVRGLRDTARMVGGLWVLFWAWFGLASGLGEGMDLPGVLVHATVPGLAFVVCFRRRPGPDRSNTRSRDWAPPRPA